MEALNVHSLLAEQGARRIIDLTVPEEIVVSASPLIGNPDKHIKLLGPLSAKGSLTNIGDEILRLDCDCAAKLLMPCNRCTVPVEINLEFHMTERFAREEEIDKIEAEHCGLQSGDSSEDLEKRELEPIVSERIDLENVLIYELQLNIPMKVLCKEDCKGLCPACGQNLNVSPCGCSFEEHDERWDALKGLFE